MEIFMDNTNPFIIQGYLSPDYFCDREVETNKIISAYKNGRNITLFSLRRMGKTSLIENVFHTLRNDGKNHLVYFDIYATSNLSDFINLFGKVVFYELIPDKKNILELITNTLKNVTPAIVFDRLTGEPSFQFSFKNRKEEELTIEEIFKYLNSKKKKILIAIDEFQQILNYPEKNVEALLRTYISKSNNLNFIYSGSEKHILLSMFSDKGKPFYQSSEFLHLDRISSEKYSRFIKEKFSSGGFKITEEIISLILNWTSGFTYHTQFLCNKIFEQKIKQITIENVKKIMDEILTSNEIVYLHYRTILTDLQWKLLGAIAKEESVGMITSKDFIRLHNLSTPSSIQSAIEALVKKDFVSYENNRYFLSDIYLSRWLERI